MKLRPMQRSGNMQKDPPTIVIFGTGQAGLHAMRQLGKRCRIIAFLDNSLQMQGRYVAHIPVIPPDSISKIHFDWICLASMYRDEMARQLLDLGVPLFKLRDGSSSEWEASQFPPPLSGWASRETILIGPYSLCLKARKKLAGNLNILGIHSRYKGRIQEPKAELYIIVSRNPEIEFFQLTKSGIPINAIDVLSLDFLQ